MNHSTKIDLRKELVRNSYHDEVYSFTFKKFLCTLPKIQPALILLFLRKRITKICGGFWGTIERIDVDKYIIKRKWGWIGCFLNDGSYIEERRKDFIL